MNANRAGCIILLFVGIVAWVAFVPITNEDRVGIAALDALVTETTFIHSNHEFNDNGTNPPTVSSVAKRRLPRQQSASWSPSAALRAFEGTCLNELPALFESSREF
ncbi:membrane-associated protein, putative [Bodo saltans]|uniref:Membrane-associated protein, putative n=1 Tax=Bodo saltans TaxID=75058 RepID=A0A0S4KIM5_BODSA|nr:membrane-associated protein, putative [Bodo saltans]|eukprot:CUI14283.1 membrane-associated protein, putative [Bodo saltans]